PSPKNPRIAAGTARAATVHVMSFDGSRTSYVPRCSPKNVISHVRVAYAAVNATVASNPRYTSHATAPATTPPWRAACWAASMTESLLNQPLSGGTPASAARPIVIDQNVTGMPCLSPP